MRLGTFTIGAETAARAALFTADDRTLDLVAAGTLLAASGADKFVAALEVLHDAPVTHTWLTSAGLSAITRVVSAIAGDAACWYPRHTVRLGVPISRPGKIIAAGRNYLDHVREGQQLWAARGRTVEVPKVPSAFAKCPSSLSAPFTPIVIPSAVEAVDYEAELAVVIGTAAHNVSEAAALHHVAGYTICNDVGARRIQMAEMEQQIGIVLAKNFPTFAPLGPWLVTADEIPDPQQLAISLTVNGEVRQEAHTRDMIFTVAKLISYWSQTGLEVGDVISTGTPVGVAIGRAEPARFFLRDGDTVTACTERIGELTNPVRG